MAKRMNETNKTVSPFSSKLKDYKELTKFTLSFTVVFTCVICFLLVPDNGYDWKMMGLLFIAGMLITGSANAINQAVEKDTDAVMKRTATRPVASGRMSQQEAYTFALIAGAVGVLMMWYFFNVTSALISAFSLFLYSYIYTPLKKINSIAVLVGAFPGALPCLIGWTAGFYGQDISWTGGLILFGIQFIWQFPHFWAIAWVSHQDYSKAGFKLLPADKGPTKFTAMQSIIYSALMIPMGFVPYFTGISGMTSFFILLACNLWMVYVSVMLFIRMNAKSARMVMFSAYFYLMIVLLALFANRVA